MLSANRGMSRFGKEPPAPAGGAPLFWRYYQIVDESQDVYVFQKNQQFMLEKIIFLITMKKILEGEYLNPSQRGGKANVESKGWGCSEL